VNLCNCCYLYSTCTACMLQCGWGAWWCVSQSTSCRLWHDRYNLQGANFGALHYLGLHTWLSTQDCVVVIT
jgi:hypothetical protein